MKRPINTTCEDLCPCVTEEFAHTSLHHFIEKRMDRRFNMIGIMEVYEDNTCTCTD